MELYDSMIETENENLDEFEYVEFDGDFPFFPFYIGNTIFQLIDLIN